MLGAYGIVLILGIVEGLTEFIPVSSTGHLILFGNILSFVGERAETFEVFIQLGAILAVVILYFPRFLGFLDFNAGSQSTGWAGILRIGAACVPAFVLGALLHGPIKELLFAPLPVAAALIAGGLIMIFVERSGPAPEIKNLEGITPLNAFLIGAVQCFSLWPGISRSGSTIVGGLLLKLDRKTAAEFSFLVAVPVMFAAVAFDLLKSINHLSAADVPIFAVGFVTAFITAVAAIKFFMALLNRFTLVPFGVYRIALGALVLAVYYAR